MRTGEDPYTALNTTVGIHIARMLELLSFLSLSLYLVQPKYA